ncbi:hypothetical protein ACJZ2D_013095 [Fusarium nematophilum]
MSHYGFGYGPPHGYQASQPYYSTSQPYVVLPFPSNENAGSQPSAYGRGAAESYDYNRATIPGLGMGFSGNTTGWQNISSNGPPETASERNDTSPTKEIADSSNARPAASTDDDAMEEGELSEGELEDLYKPGEMDISKEAARPPQTRGAIANVPRHETNAQRHAASAPQQPCGTAPLPRDRSGSYSPYLSPREIQSNGLDNGPSHAQTPRSDVQPPAIETTVPETVPQLCGRNMSTSQDEMKQADSVVTESRKRAREAILRLWPLNVRYQHYVEEGIDKVLLDELFKELGLDSTAAAQGIRQVEALVPLHVSPPASNAPDTQDRLTEASHTIEKPKSPEKPKDKSEERKDRIARLLAAKGSKPGATDNKASKPAAVDQTMTVSTDSQPGNAEAQPEEAKSEPEKAKSQPEKAKAQPEKAKTQSEKSKLIQQRMEALIKSREANAKATAQVRDSSTPPVASAHPGLGDASGAAPESTTDADDQVVAASEVADTADTASAHPIPGLFLSSNAPSPVTNPRKRPLAADLNEYSTPAVQNRPFGQARESRPFLIDVSDDEDDAEMELDSPELRPSSIQRPVTPGSRTTSFRDHPALSDSASRRAVSTPKGAGTPTTSGNGLYNLESMNKKIEDMKRKIAEAEARKKAKLSNNESPSLPQSEAQSKESSIDATLQPKRVTPTPPGSGVAAEESRPSIPLPPRPDFHTLAKVPKIRGQQQRARPSLRARVASERLPILEARRREQTEQLNHLQSEVARIEREIQDSLVEEERLREDAFQPESAGQGESESDEVQAESQPPENDSRDDTAAMPAEESNGAPSSEDADQDTSMDESSSSESVDAKEAIESREDEAGALGQETAEEVVGHRDRASAPPGSLGTADDMLAPLETIPQEPPYGNAEESEDDAVMEDIASSSDETDAAEGSSDDYEPTEAGVELPDHQSPTSPPVASVQAPLVDGATPEKSNSDVSGVSAAHTGTQQISMGDGDPGSDSGREVRQTTETPVISGPKSSFVPYESPLQCFRAYRFHPQYKDSVSGGLRSLTYSNKIDVKREVCPDQLTEGTCPRGSECHFQHFESMEAPDDQILLQLGAYSNYEEDQTQQYVAGLRDLLTDFRNRKVKDFQTISEGIIEYRAKFHGDKTKILPLGGVAI